MSTPTAVAVRPRVRIERRIEPAHRGRLARIVRGRSDDPTWARPALLALLAATALLYLLDLSASGYANSFYAAAVQAGTHSWKAWFFGSLDSGNSITVDKPPASLWIMGLSARIFGFSSWSLLAPQALEGVAAVGLLYGAVRRVAGHGAGLLAGAILALTPAAVLMFRFDNPDALLILLVVAAAYATTRAIETGRTGWLLLAGTALGFAFLTKMLQGFLVIPGLAVAYAFAAPVSVWRRIRQLVLAGLAVLVSAGWWVATVSLWPASSRPYIGGSTDNSVLNLVFGYNGLSRISGSSGAGGGGGASGGGSTGTSFGGAAGVRRLFDNEFGNEISWLLPAALVAVLVGLWLTRRAARTDAARASLLLWGGWLAVTGVVLAYMKGTVHPYYTVQLAPAIAALVAVGVALCWRRRGTVTGRVGLAAIVVAAGSWSTVLLDRVGSWHPELRVLVVAGTTLVLLALLVPARRLGRSAGLVAVGGLLAGLLGTGAFATATAARAHTGSIPTVGPAVAGGQGGGFGGAGGPGGGSSGPGASGAARAGQAMTGTPPSGTSGTATSGTAPTGTARSGGTAPSGGGGTTTSAALTAALKASTQTWAAAAVGDQSAAELELASGKAVISIGGWSGSDASPTLAQFEARVAAGQIHYFIAGGGMGGGNSSGTASQITAWVEAHYTATTIGGQTVYDLTATAR